PMRRRSDFDPNSEERADAKQDCQRTFAPALTMTRGRNKRGNHSCHGWAKLTAGRLGEFIEVSQTNYDRAKLQVGRAWLIVAQRIAAYRQAAGAIAEALRVRTCCLE